MTEVEQSELLGEMQATYRRYVTARHTMEQAQAEYEHASLAYWKMRVIAAPNRGLDRLAREAVEAEAAGGGMKGKPPPPQLPAHTGAVGGQGQERRRGDEDRG